MAPSGGLERPAPVLRTGVAGTGGTRCVGSWNLARGPGMDGEYPYVPVAVEGAPYGLDAEFEENLIVCVERYIGDPDHGAGVKLEDQYLVTDAGAHRMRSIAFDARLVG